MTTNTNTVQTWDNWQDIQNEIGEFTDKTFGQSTVESKFEHLREELDEVIADPKDELEWADCLILLLDAARREGFDMTDLHKAITKKMEINRARKWGSADENGVVKHI